MLDARRENLGGFTFIILKPRAEGYETEIVANFAVRGPINRLTCMRKTQAQNTLTVWVFASDETRARWENSDETPWHFTARRNKVPLRQSPKCKWIIARVRNRNNEGQCGPLREGREI